MPILYRSIVLFPRDLGRRSDEIALIRFPASENPGLKYVRRLAVRDVDAKYRAKTHGAVLYGFLQALPLDCLEVFKSVNARKR